MTSGELLNNIREYCKAKSNEEQLQKSQHYFKEEFIGYGLTAPQLHDKVKELLKSGEIDIQTVIESAPVFMESRMYEEISFALLLLNGFWKQFTPETFRTIAGWFSISIRNWAHADTLGMFLLPRFLERKVVPVEAFVSWLDSPYKFQRRCVPVTLIKHIKKTREVMPSIHFVEKLMADPEREVHQGMGWFLREAWKISPSETEVFLGKYKDTAPRLIINYACEKMTTENKARFKRTQ
jgi:3-methyladenine DNA glycosylase AlkD